MIAEPERDSLLVHQECRKRKCRKPRPFCTGAFVPFPETARLTAVIVRYYGATGVTAANATACGKPPTGIVATTLLLAVSITETVLSNVFVT